MCIDSNMKHAEAEVDRLFAQSSEGGQILMPLDAYPFRREFTWLSDRYGVSWQPDFSGEQALARSRDRRAFMLTRDVPWRGSRA